MTGFRCVGLYLLLLCDTTRTPTILQRMSRPSLSDLECLTPCFVVLESCLALKDVRLRFVALRSVSTLVLLITIQILIKISMSSSSWSFLFCPSKAIFQSGRREGCNHPPHPSSFLSFPRIVLPLCPHIKISHRFWLQISTLAIIP